MNLTIDLPYNAVIGSVFGITILGVVYLISRAVIKVKTNQTVSCNCKDKW